MTRGAWKRRTFLLWPVAIWMLLLGCATDECLQNQTSLPLAGFYTATASPQQITVDSLSIYGLGAPGDSVLVHEKERLSSTYLPFRIDGESTTYVIRYMQKALERYNLADTITFNYEMQPWFVSTACGTIYRYDMRDIKHTTWLIDSVTCPPGVIDNTDMENLRIYFKVAAEE